MGLTPTWSTILFAGKWLFIGLVYLALLVILLAVRRELKQHTAGVETSKVVALGRLRVIQPGTDAQIALGSVLSLQPVTTLGAEADNTLVLGDQFVSGRHARLTWDGVGWWVEDLGSSNGTRIDGQPCAPHVRQRLPVGGRLALGDMVLELVE